ncbi:MAG: hypothetical protein WAT81_02800 [Candidatus Moraniibacteriota bacterium]
MGTIQKQKSVKFRKYIASLLIGTVLFTTAVPLPARAGVWGESIAGELLGQVLDVIWEQLQAVLLGIAKKVAIQLARDAANRLVAGGSSKKPVFITDYKQYIMNAAHEEGRIYMDSLLTSALGGKNSMLNYVIAGGSLSQLGMNYMNYINADVSSAFARNNCKYNLDQYTSNPMVSLSQGDWRVLNAVVSNNCNNPLGMRRNIVEQTQRQISSVEEIAKTKAIAGQGFLGVEVNGKTVTPGSVISDVTSKLQTAIVDQIGMSTKWQELLAAAAGAFVNQAMNSLYQQGFEIVAKNLTRELGKVDTQIKGARADLQRQLGPGSQFLRNSNQQLGGWNGSAGTAGKYSGVQQSIINFNTTPDPDP